MVLQTGRPVPPPGPRGRVPRLYRCNERLRLLAVPASLRCLTLTVTAVRLFRSHRRRRAVVGLERLGALLLCALDGRNDELSQVPGESSACMPRSWTPVGPRCQVVAAPRCGLPYSGRRRLPLLPCFEARSRGLHAPCLRFAREVARQDARLGSVWLTNLHGRGDIPLDSIVRFQCWIIITSSSPRLCLAQPETGGLKRQ
jgi:hypothetical protein